jgi:hypothetical protein
MRALGLIWVLLIPPPAFASDSEQRLLGVWKVESWYTEFKATGEKQSVVARAFRRPGSRSCRALSDATILAC